MLGKGAKYQVIRFLFDNPVSDLFCDSLQSRLFNGRRRRGQKSLALLHSSGRGLSQKAALVPPWRSNSLTLIHTLTHSP